MPGAYAHITLVNVLKKPVDMRLLITVLHSVRYRRTV